MSDDGQQRAKISTGDIQSTLTFEQKEEEEVGEKNVEEESAYFWQATFLIPRESF